MTKYSLKNIFLGIGIGLVIASVANINVTPKKLTVDEIRREAEQYNLIVMDAKDLIIKEPAAPQEQADQQPPSQNEILTIVIEPGSNSDIIANQLFEKKLITSKKEFLSRLKELDRESKIQIGSFKISSGSSIDKIIETITNAPK